MSGNDEQHPTKTSSPQTHDFQIIARRAGRGSAAKPANSAVTPARRMARLKSSKLQRQVFVVVFFMLMAYLAFAFVRLGYTNIMLVKDEKAVSQKHKQLKKIKHELRENIQMSETIDGQKDQMRKTGRFPKNESPFIVLDEKK